MSSETAFFSVDTRLAKLLGEAYRSTEAALKELVDNAWDSDADTVWITLPKELGRRSDCRSRRRLWHDATHGPDRISRHRSRSSFAQG